MAPSEKKAINRKERSKLEKVPLRYRSTDERSREDQRKWLLQIADVKTPRARKELEKLRQGTYPFKWISITDFEDSRSSDYGTLTFSYFFGRKKSGP